MNTNEQPDVGIIYSGGCFSAEEIRELETELNKCGLVLVTQERNKTIWASMDFFVPIVQVFLSPEVIHSFFIGFASSLVYDYLKTFVKTIWEKVKRKKPCKVSGGKIEDYKYPIHITTGNISAVFPTNVDETIINRYIDKLFEHLNTVYSVEHIYAIYNEKTGCFEDYSEAEIIDKAIREQNREHDTTSGDRNPECNTQQGG